MDDHFQRGSEIELIRQLWANDADAWRSLVQAYSGLLLGVARRTFFSHGFQVSDQDAEDVVSDVWRNLLDHNRQMLRQCREQGRILPLLLTLTRNRAVDQMRRHKNFLVPLTDQVPEPVEEAESRVPEFDCARLTEHVWSVLSSRERTCVKLFYLQRRKYREIERLTGISINSIGPTLQRALEKLRGALSGLPEE